MRARILVTAAVVIGGALGALLTRQLLRRRRDRRAAKLLDGQRPIEAIGLEELENLCAIADAMVLADDATRFEGDPLQLDPVVVVSLEEIEEGASHPAHLAEDRAEAHGENWVEALQEETIEDGLAPGVVLVFTDEVTARTDVRDRPVADRGSGGPRGW